MTSSLFAAASATDADGFAPSLTAASSAAVTMSKATTSNPFLTRLASIGCPIVPVPINPIFIVLPPSQYEIAAIDRDRATRHPTRFIRSEIEDRAGDIFWLPHAAERDLRNRRAPSFGVGIAGAGQPGQGRAGSDRVDPDAVRRQLQRHRMRQRAAAALRGDVGRALRASDLGKLRGHVEDAAAASLADHLSRG